MGIFHPLWKTEDERQACEKAVRKQKFMKLAYRLSLLLCILLLSSCSGKALDTPENRRTFAEDAMMAYDVPSSETLYVGIEAPWLAVREETAEDGGKAYCLLGMSKELSELEFSHELLDRVNTLVICRVTENSADYRSTSGVMSKGTAETAELVYYRVDREAGTLVRYAGEDRVANELPETSAKTPHLTVSAQQVVSAVEKRAQSHTSPVHPTNYFQVSKEGELDQYFVLGRHETIVLPDNVKRITRMAFGNEANDITVWVPASVEEIAEHTFRDYKKTFTLVVEPGSCAEQYALENEIPYVYAEDYEP